jgi:polar amino acid transport system permease protein
MDMLPSLPSMLAGLSGGLAVTFGVSALSAALGFVLALLICWMRCSRGLFRRPAAAVYISAVRGIPVLVVLLLLFYLPGAFGVSAPPVLAAVLALGINSSAFQAEILRAGFAAVPHGQSEASKALGISRVRHLWRILLPQALGLTMPQLVNECIILVKNSSLISVIAVTELLRRGEQIVSTTYRPLEVYCLAALFYLAVTLAISRCGHLAQRRLTWRGPQTQGD